MNPTELDVHNPRQVDWQQPLVADLGGGRSLVVLSGIGIPEFDSVDDELRALEWRVLLHEPAESLEAWTAHVGLTSISNDDSSWVFATDHVNLVVENEELVLLVHLVVRGDSSFLHRFSYQVVLTRRAVTTGISGTLSWPTRWFRPVSADPGAVAGAFTITANTIALGALGALQLTPVATGVIETVTIADDTCRATYRIVGALKGQTLLVDVHQHSLSLTTASMVPVDPGSVQFTLTATSPDRTGVDFFAKNTPGPA